MDDSQGGGTRKRAAEDLILRTIAAHADSLLRTARRHSICIDDAQDAYQRAIELFMSHAPRLDAARAPGWLLSTQAIAVTDGSDLSRLVTGGR
jgi:DNA-directed RNA polymerase specialized sigma24 family protein